jgi:hypothetical protein
MNPSPRKSIPQYNLPLPFSTRPPASPKGSFQQSTPCLPQVCPSPLPTITPSCLSEAGVYRGQSSQLELATVSCLPSADLLPSQTKAGALLLTQRALFCLLFTSRLSWTWDLMQSHKAVKIRAEESPADYQTSPSYFSAVKCVIQKVQVPWSKVSLKCPKIKNNSNQERALPLPLI